MMNDESMGAILLGAAGRAPVALPVMDNSVPVSSKVHFYMAIFKFQTHI